MSVVKLKRLKASATELCQRAASCARFAGAHPQATSLRSLAATYKEVECACKEEAFDFRVLQQTEPLPGWSSSRSSLENVCGSHHRRILFCHTPQQRFL